MFPYTSILQPNYTELFKQNLIYLKYNIFVAGILREKINYVKYIKKPVNKAFILVILCSYATNWVHIQILLRFVIYFLTCFINLFFFLICLSVNLLTFPSKGFSDFLKIILN